MAAATNPATQRPAIKLTKGRGISGQPPDVADQSVQRTPEGGTAFGRKADEGVGKPLPTAGASATPIRFLRMPSNTWGDPDQCNLGALQRLNGAGVQHRAEVVGLVARAVPFRPRHF